MRSLAPDWFWRQHMKNFKKVTLLAALIPAIFALSGCGGSSSSLSTQAALTISASPSTVATGATSTLSATGGSGTGSVSYAVQSGSCTISGTTLTAPTAAGTCTVSATKGGDSSYLSASSNTLTITVAKATNTITFSAPSSVTVGGAAVTLTGIASSGLPVTYTSSTPSACTVSGTALTPVTDTTCTIVASQAGNTIYPAATPVTVSFSINGTAQTVTFPAPTALQAGSTEALTATASSGLAVTYTASPASVCTVSGSTLTAVAAGTCSISASQTGNTTYAAAATQTQTVAVSAVTPVSTALTFMTGFAGNGLTNEGGTVGGYAGSDLDGWNCTTAATCNGGGSPAGTAAGDSYYYYYYQPASIPTQGEYVGFSVFAPGVTSLSSTANTSGVTITNQTSITFTFNQNPEWFNLTNHNAFIELTLGNYYSAGGGCHIQLQKVFTPTSVNATTYTFPLSSFTVAQNCAVGSLTPSSVAAALSGNPIAKIDIQGDGGTAALTPANGTLTSSANMTTVANGTYPTTVVLKGAITFQ